VFCLHILDYFESKLKKDKDISESTVKHYMSDLSVFSQYISNTYKKRVGIEDINEHTIDAFIVYLDEILKYSSSSKYRIGTFFKKLCCYLKEDGFLKDVPLNVLGDFKYTIERSLILPEDLLSLLMRYIRKKKNRKHIVIFSLLLNTGIMVKDLINLKAKDVYYKDGFCFIKVIDREYPVAEKTKKDIDNYLSEEDKDRIYFIEGERGQYTTSGIYRVITKYGHLIDIKISARMLRNCFFYYYEKYNFFEYPNTLRYITKQKLLLRYKTPSKEKIYNALCNCEF